MQEVIELIAVVRTMHEVIEQIAVVQNARSD